MPESVLRLENVVKKFGSVSAVDGVSLDIHKGEFLTLLGPSGCGKSTTLNLVAGFLAPTSGSIYLDGRIINDLPPFERDTGMVFQDYALFPHMTVEENIGFGLRMRKIARPEIAERVAQVLSLVKLEGLGGRSTSQLSGGQQQRVALARALVIEPAVLLLDEPLSNLDMKLRESMRIEIMAIQKKIGITTVFVTHDQTEALVMSDRIVVMNEGRVVQVGTPVEIYEHPETKFVAEFIGMTNFFYGRIVELQTGVDRALFRSERGLELPVRIPDGIAPGQAVHVSLRPEKCSLSLTADSVVEGVAVKGRVDQVIYLGSKTDYILTLGHDERGMVEIHNAGPEAEFRPGDEVYLCADPRDCLVLRADG